MKLIATKWISDAVPEGAAFEIPDHDLPSAHALIEGGYARADMAAEAPASTPDDEPTPRRSYRRRDLTAEP